jgi:catechol 2,3-dioxygenase-like lactoylglutathione lyase family enzyme
MNLDHINIKAPASMMEKEKLFFCEVLGLHKGHRPDFSSEAYWLYSVDQSLGHLSLGAQFSPGERQGYLDHLALRTTELQQLLQRLEAADIDYSTNHVSQLGMTQISLKSPSATGIEVVPRCESLTGNCTAARQR